MPPYKISHRGELTSGICAPWILCFFSLLFLNVFVDRASYICAIRANSMHYFTLNLFHQLTSTCFEQVYCSPSGGTFLYIQQLLCVMCFSSFKWVCWRAVVHVDGIHSCIGCDLGSIAGQEAQVHAVNSLPKINAKLVVRCTRKSPWRDAVAINSFPCLDYWTASHR